MKRGNDMYAIIFYLIINLFFTWWIFSFNCVLLFLPHSSCRWTTCSWKSVLSKVLSRHFSHSGWMPCWPVCPIGSFRGPADKSCLRIYARRSVTPISESWSSTEVSQITALEYNHIKNIILWHCCLDNVKVVIQYHIGPVHLS